MSKYGKVALLAVEKAFGSQEPVSAWKLAATEVFQDKTASIEKGCPKGAFLGLAERGLIKGIAPGKYTKSKLNKNYAIVAVQLLQRDELLKENKQKLWHLSCGSEKKAHNSQMDVALALWEESLIEVQHLNNTSS